MQTIRSAHSVITTFMLAAISLVVGSFTPCSYADTILRSPIKGPFVEDPNAEVEIEQDFPGGWTGKTEHDPPPIPKPAKLKKKEKGFKRDPNGTVFLQHVIEFDWDPKPKKMTFAMVQVVDPNDPNTGMTGFELGDIPTISELSYEILDVGILTPFMFDTISIVDLGTVGGIGDLIDPFLDPNASGMVPIAMFQVPDEAFIPEPSTLALFSIGALGLFRYSWRRRKVSYGIK